MLPMATMQGPGYEPETVLFWNAIINSKLQQSHERVRQLENASAIDASRLFELDVRCRELEKASASETSRRLELEARCHDLEKASASETSRRLELEARCRELEKASAGETSRCIKLEARCDELESAGERWRMELEAARALDVGRCHKLEARCRELESRCTALDSDRKAAEMQLASIRALSKDKGEIVSQLAKLKKEMAANDRASKQSKSGCESLVLQLTAQARELQDKLAAREARCAELELDIKAAMFKFIYEKEEMSRAAFVNNASADLITKVGSSLNAHGSIIVGPIVDKDCAEYKHLDAKLNNPKVDFREEFRGWRDNMRHLYENYLRESVDLGATECLHFFNATFATLYVAFMLGEGTLKSAAQSLRGQALTMPDRTKDERERKANFCNKILALENTIDKVNLDLRAAVPKQLNLELQASYFGSAAQPRAPTPPQSPEKRDKLRK